MLPELNDYSAIRQAFHWQIPDRFNIGTSVCTRWAQSDPQRTAIIARSRQGDAQNVSFDQLERLVSFVLEVEAEERHLVTELLLDGDECCR